MSSIPVANYALNQFIGPLDRHFFTQAFFSRPCRRPNVGRGSRVRLPTYLRAYPMHRGLFVAFRWGLGRSIFFLSPSRDGARCWRAPELFLHVLGSLWWKIEAMKTFFMRQHSSAPKRPESFQDGPRRLLIDVQPIGWRSGALDGRRRLAPSHCWP